MKNITDTYCFENGVKKRINGNVKIHSDNEVIKLVLGKISEKEVENERNYKRWFNDIKENRFYWIYSWLIKDKAVIRFIFLFLSLKNILYLKEV